MSKVLVLAALAALTLVLAGCAEADDDPCPEGFESQLAYDLFFGLSDSAGDTVSEEGWQAFLADVITPRFPAGLTVIDFRGQWTEPGGSLQREPGKLVVGLLAAPGDGSLGKVNEISEEFERRFDQDPVFRIVREVCAGLS